MFLKYYVLDEKTNFQELIKEKIMPTVTKHCAEPSTGILRMQPMAVGIYTPQS